MVTRSWLHQRSTVVSIVRAAAEDGLRLWRAYLTVDMQATKSVACESITDLCVAIWVGVALNNVKHLPALAALPLNLAVVTRVTRVVDWSSSMLIEVQLKGMSHHRNGLRRTVAGLRERVGTVVVIHKVWSGRTTSRTRRPGPHGRSRRLMQTSWARDTSRRGPERHWRC